MNMVGVCIKYFHENYGGMLQAYATVSMLEARKIEYELIRYKKRMTLAGAVRSLPRLLNGILLNDKYEAFRKSLGKKLRPEFAENDAIRMGCFHRFRDAHFVELSPVFYGYDQLCKGVERYSAVITGSDQLWSPAGLPTNFYNLQFVPDEIRKISYASSFGVKNIPWYQKRRTASFLRRMDYISMRENRGSEIVAELTRRNAPVIVDPVFMFDADGWERLIPVKPEIDEPYLFAYFLGRNKDYRRAVEDAAHKLGCKVIALRHLDQYVPEDEEFGNYAPYDVGPDRFLNLLRGAAYVCTDSFHGVCFSIIHKKKFVVFNRYKEGAANSKNSRIDTVCSNLNLSKRRFAEAVPLAVQLSEEIDYSRVQECLADLVKSAEQYLDEALQGIEK